MSQEQLQQVQRLLQEQRYEEALALLRTIDTPQAQQLIQQVEQSIATQAAAQAMDVAAAAPTPAPQSTRDGQGRRVTQEGVYEMLWDCQYCGATKLLGKTHRFCPNCGAAQDPDSRYFPAEDEYVAVHDHRYVGVDVTCPNCEALNSGSAEFCGTCGAPLTDAARAKTLETQTRDQGQQFASSGSRDLAQERFDAEMERIGVKPKARAGDSGRSWLKYGLIGLGVALVAFILVLIFLTKESPVYVTGHSWEHEVRVDEYKSFDESTWCSSGLPAGAYNVSRRSEVHHTNQIPDGEDCTTRRVDQGDGTFRQERVCTTRYRPEPVYQDKCYYTINRWDYAYSEYTRGSSRDDALVWPEPSYNCQNQARLGCQREGGLNAEYLLHLHASEGDADYTCGIELARWQNAVIESRFTLAVGVIGGEARCDTLQEAP